MTKLAVMMAFGVGLSGPMTQACMAKDNSGFNGAWAVELVTESGLCDSRYSYSVSVQEGHVRLVSSGANATLTGRVGADGTVGLNVSNGSASGSASGKLQAKTGGGSWKVSSLCSGRWTARRTDTRTAQAL